MKHQYLLSLTAAAFLFIQTPYVANAQASGKSKQDSTQVKKNNDLKELPDPNTLTWKKNIALGDKLFEMGRIYNGLKYYEEALTQNPGQTSIYFNMANGYFSLRDYKTANKYFKMLLDIDSVKHEDYQSLYYYALTDKYDGNYERAKKNFARFIQAAQGKHELDERSKTAALEEQGCVLGLQLRNEKSTSGLKAVLLDTNVNKPYTNYSPIMKDANTICYGAWVSNDVVLVGKKEKHGSYSRIYYAKKNKQGWDNAVLAPGEMNKEDFHVGNAAFTADGKTMYYTQCTEDDNLRMWCNIYRSTLGDTGWTAGKMLDANINAKGFTNTEPALGKNEAGDEVLYFVSDRSKGMSTDIFYAKINSDGSFGKAFSLGQPINTADEEQTPFYDYNTGTLYFSSNGHVTMGGFDVFKTKFVNGAWTEPENAGVPINSSADDWYYNWNTKTNSGFVVSNRSGGYGVMNPTCCDDIYQLVKINFAVMGSVMDEATGKPIIEPRVVLLDVDADRRMPLSPMNGNYFFDLDPGKIYKVSATKEGYFAAAETISTKNKERGDTITTNLLLKKIEKNVVYKLNNIYYEFDKYDLTPASKVALDTLYILLRDNPSIVIELSSHTDSKGADKYNQDLSQKRAESCVNYLVKEKGITQTRIIAKGYGKTQPIAPNNNPDGSDNPDGRAMNRRTQFKVIGEVKE